MTASRPDTFVVLVAFLAAVAAGAWLWPVRPGQSEGARLAEERWDLDRPSSRPLDFERAAVAASRLWGSMQPGAATVAPLEEELTAADWRVSGIYFNASSGAAIISSPGQPDRHLGVGDALPGGAHIRAISATRICIVLNGRLLSLGLYRE